MDLIKGIKITFPVEVFETIYHKPLLIKNPATETSIFCDRDTKIVYINPSSIIDSNFDKIEHLLTMIYQYNFYNTIIKNILDTNKSPHFVRYFRILDSVTIYKYLDVFDNTNISKKNALRNILYMLNNLPNKQPIEFNEEEQENKHENKDEDDIDLLLENFDYTLNNTIPKNVAQTNEELIEELAFNIISLSIPENSIDNYFNLSKSGYLDILLNIQSKKFIDFYVCLFQIAQACFTVYEKNSALNMNNFATIPLSVRDKKVVTQYILDDLVIKLKTNICVRISDFKYSYSYNLNDNPLIKKNNVCITNNFCDEYRDIKDFLLILLPILKTIIKEFDSNKQLNIIIKEFIDLFYKSNENNQEDLITVENIINDDLNTLIEKILDSHNLYSYSSVCNNIISLLKYKIDEYNSINVNDKINKEELFYEHKDIKVLSENRFTIISREYMKKKEIKKFLDEQNIFAFGKLDYKNNKIPYKYLSGLLNFERLVNTKLNKTIYLLGEQHNFENTCKNENDIITADNFFFSLLNSTPKIIDVFMEFDYDPTKDKSYRKTDTRFADFYFSEKSPINSSFMGKINHSLAYLDCFRTGRKNLCDIYHKNIRFHLTDVRNSSIEYLIYINSVFHFITYGLEIIRKRENIIDFHKELYKLFYLVDKIQTTYYVYEDKDFVLKAIQDILERTKINKQISKIKPEYQYIVKLCMDRFYNIIEQQFQFYKPSNILKFLQSILYLAVDNKFNETPNRFITMIKKLYFELFMKMKNPKDTFDENIKQFYNNLNFYGIYQDLYMLLRLFAIDNNNNIIYVGSAHLPFIVDILMNAGFYFNYYPKTLNDKACLNISDFEITWS